MGKEDLVMRMRRLVFDKKVENGFSCHQKDEFMKCLLHFGVWQPVPEGQLSICRMTLILNPLRSSSSKYNASVINHLLFSTL